MKQRITYVVKNPDSFTPDQLAVRNDGPKATLTLTDVDAVKEHRITVGLDELPRELTKHLEQWHELHIRWASETPYSTIPPFTSRVSPGLHVFFTPLEDTPEDALCHGLHSVFSDQLKCSSMNETAIKLSGPSKRYSTSASSQYYSPLPSLAAFTQGLEKQICSRSKLLGDQCAKLVTSLQSASYLDMDYDTNSRALTLTSFWSSAPSQSGWTETLSRLSANSRVEIGVLTSEPNPDPEDIQFGGFLTVLGESSAPKATRFQTPTRHYPLPSSSNPTFTTTLQTPTGLHPVLTLSLPGSALSPPSETCTLHAHLTLPSTLFIDPHQFNDPLFLASKNLTALSHLSGTTNLEAPTWQIPQWGTSALFHLSLPSSQEATTTSSKTLTHQILIPLHTRYLPASPLSSHISTPLPWPAVFWACPADATPAAMAGNPFDRVHLGYEGFFEQATRFMHVQPRGGDVEAGTNPNPPLRLVEYIDVPVLDVRRAGWVQVGTGGVVILAFLGLWWVLVGGRGGGRGTATGRDGAKDKKENKKKQ